MLNYYYEWPKTRTEANIFAKEIFRLPDFWKDLTNKLVWGMVAAGGDTALKLAAWQTVYGGTWSPQEFADFNIYKPFVCGVMAFGSTCFTGVPFENAARAYYADKTWPIELRRGYKSQLHALLRIPFEEGPAYLFRGVFPIAMNQFLFWTLYCHHYIYLKNKFFLFHVYNDFSYDYIKFLFHSFAFFLGSTLAYPAYHVREMVDIWPKERGGFCTFNNSYRQAFRWMVQNMELHFYTYMRGFSYWMKRYGYIYYISLWMADSLGMMTNCNEAYNSLETIFPIFAESQ